MTHPGKYIEVVRGLGPTPSMENRDRMFRDGSGFLKVAEPDGTVRHATADEMTVAGFPDEPDLSGLVGEELEAAERLTVEPPGNTEGYLNDAQAAKFIELAMDEGVLLHDYEKLAPDAKITMPGGAAVQLKDGKVV